MTATLNYSQKGSSVSYTYSQMTALSDDELISAHDGIAGNVVMGTQYYLDELRHRKHTRIVEEQGRVAISVERFTRRLFWLTVFIGTATAINVSVAIFVLVR